jgi:short-subunit dehydrogenase
VRIAGSTVLLTGATGGIGRVLATRLIAGGATVVITGRNAEATRSLADELGARAIIADLADPDDVRRLAETSQDADILVANAALPASGEFLEYTPEQVDRALTVNLRAPIMLARLLAPRMVAAGSGHLAFVGSLSGKAATKFASLYTATKFGLRGFAHGFRQDLHGTGVGVSLVQPGFVSEAGMFADTGASTPAGIRTVGPDKVANALVKAIERNRCEVNVAPMELRLLSAIAGQFPGFAEKLARRVNTEATATRMVEAQRDAR